MTNDHTSSAITPKQSAQQQWSEAAHFLVLLVIILIKVDPVFQIFLPKKKENQGN